MVRVSDRCVTIAHGLRRQQECAEGVWCRICIGRLMSSSFALILSAGHWRNDPTLPVQTSNKLEIQTFYTRDQGGVKTMEMLDFEGTGTLSLFIERGEWSGHPYQPNVNHRECRFSALTEDNVDGDRKTSDPLLKSIFEAERESTFENPPPTLFFYEVQANTTGQPIHSLSNLMMQCQGNAEVTSRRGIIQGETAHPLSMKSLKRLATVLGYHIDEANLKKKAQGSSTTEIGTLLGSIILGALDVPLKTGKDVGEFVKKCQLLQFFENDDFTGKVPVADLLHKLGFILRTLCPVRVAIPEGQHRMALACFCMTGFFEPSSKAPLERVDMSSSKYSTTLMNKKKFRDLQIFRGMLARVVVPTGKDIATEARSLIAMGSAVTLNASRALTTTADSILFDILRHVTRNETKFEFARKKSSSTLFDLTSPGWGFNEYWSTNADAYKRYLAFTVKAINDVSLVHKEWNGVLRKVSTNNNMNWTGFVRNSTEILKCAGSHYFVNEKDKEADLKKMANIVQWACMSKESTNRLQVFLNGVPPTFLQRGTLKDTGRGYFRGFGFLDSTCRGPLRDIFRYVHNKAYYEAWLLQELSVRDAPAVEEARILEEWLHDPNVDYQEMVRKYAIDEAEKTIVFKNHKESIGDKLYNTGKQDKTTGLNIPTAFQGLNLVDASIAQYVFNGFIEATVKFGMDPVIGVDNI